jgi:hypothetical protein
MLSILSVASNSLCWVRVPFACDYLVYRIEDYARFAVRTDLAAR